MSCKKCGAPLKKGNIQVVRKKGKRPVRECRRCPQASSEAVQSVEYWPTGKGGPKYSGTGLQRPQDTTGGPITVDVVFDYPPPTRFRYFMTQDQAERVKRVLDKPSLGGFGIGFEVIPVLDYQVDQDPDTFADLVEVTVDWKNE